MYHGLNDLPIRKVSAAQEIAWYEKMLGLDKKKEEQSDDSTGSEDEH